ncbi:hypothetical protein PCANC_19759 [Puccinia coronata f. sp. avenae]|uniref:Uncharacterized protein n=1 Tax=Puccinia coronata f. sp. avenae TaxID=200324 RepID=A0A2N5UB61_9BASI|nr:hypothetical protein PCANC_19759 [Puccinia coronata f. sp. avenae]
MLAITHGQGCGSLFKLASGTSSNTGLASAAGRTFANTMFCIQTDEDLPLHHLKLHRLPHQALRIPPATSPTKGFPPAAQTYPAPPCQTYRFTVATAVDFVAYAEA